MSADAPFHGWQDLASRSGAAKCGQYEGGSRVDPHPGGRARGAFRSARHARSSPGTLCRRWPGAASARCGASTGWRPRLAPPGSSAPARVAACKVNPSSEAQERLVAGERVRLERLKAAHPLRPGGWRLARDGGGGEVALGIARDVRIGAVLVDPGTPLIGSNQLQ
jgi:hypothetical protein